MITCDVFYRNYFGIDSPFRYQHEVWDLIHNSELPILLRAPTGSGKTEAALVPFLAQFLEKKFPIALRLIYVLPMRVLVNNIAKRIERYAKNISKNISVKVQNVLNL